MNKMETLKDELKDFERDIIDLIEINHSDKKNLIIKMKRLCKAHRKYILKEFKWIIQI